MIQTLTAQTVAPSCCGEVMTLLLPQPLSPDGLGLEVDYKVTGGFNQSAVEVTWNPEHGNPEWMMLKTFTGGYLKYIASGKKPPVVFPLSDEDAYVYCDREVCQQCVFRCKLGFVIYAYFGARGLFELPLDKMAKYFDTQLPSGQ